MPDPTNIATNSASLTPATQDLVHTPQPLIQGLELRNLLGGVSDMWIWRRLQDGTLPKPILISNRRFWRRDEVADYIKRRSDARHVKEPAKSRGQIPEAPDSTLVVDASPVPKSDSRS